MTEQNTEFDFTSADDESVENTPVEPQKRTPLTSLKAALAKRVEKPPVTYKIPGREGFEMRFSTNLDQDLLEAWRKASTRRRKGRNGGEDNVDGMSLAAKILFGQNEALLYYGEEAMDDEDNLLNLRNKELATWLQAESTSPTGILRALYGYDGHILATMQDVLVASGYDTEVDIDSDEDDPTMRS